MTVDVKSVHGILFLMCIEIQSEDSNTGGDSCILKKKQEGIGGVVGMSVTTAAATSVLVLLAAISSSFSFLAIKKY